MLHTGQNNLLLLLGLFPLIILAVLGALYVHTKRRASRRHILLWHAGRMPETTPEESEHHAHLFFNALHLLRSQILTLDEHSKEYFNTLQQAGWSQLHNYLARLTEAEIQLIGLLKAGAHSEAYRLAELLLNRLPSAEVELVEQQFPQFAGLASWRQECSKTLLSVMEQLEHAALQTQELGILRHRKRQPTLFDIASVKKQLDCNKR